MSENNTTPKKRKMSAVLRQKAPKVLKGAGLDLSAAIAGGLAGCLFPMVISGAGGVAMIVAANIMDDPKKQAFSSWMKIFGATMIATVPVHLIGGSTPVMQRNADGTKSPPNAQGKTKMYFKALASKFYLDKIFKPKKGTTQADDSQGSATDGELHGSALGDLENLDAMTCELEAGAMDYAANNGMPALSGLVDDDDEEDGEMSGVDFSNF